MCVVEINTHSNDEILCQKKKQLLGVRKSITVVSRGANSNFYHKQAGRIDLNRFRLLCNLFFFKIDEPWCRKLRENKNRTTTD